MRGGWVPQAPSRTSTPAASCHRRLLGDPARPLGPRAGLAFSKGRDKGRLAVGSLRKMIRRSGGPALVTILTDRAAFRTATAAAVAGTTHRLYQLPTMPPRPVPPLLHRALNRAQVLALAIPLTGCDPLLTIEGSFWPPWIIAMVAGSVLTGLASWLLGLSGLEPYLGPPLLIYPSLWGLLTFGTWLLCFGV